MMRRMMGRLSFIFGLLALGALTARAQDEQPPQQPSEQGYNRQSERGHVVVHQPVCQHEGCRGGEYIQK